jgi:hypothetical protein
MPRIVYICWPPKEITGGIKVAFQHVELLVEAGRKAVVATPDALRPNWFDTTAEVIDHNAIRGDDVLVFPENNARFFTAFASSAQPKVVFCQNPYLVHQGLGGKLSYADFGVTHIMCPSMTVVKFCAIRFPELQVRYTPFYIDHGRFKLQTQKTMQIAVVPRKRMVEFGAIADLLRARYPEFSGIPWMYLHGVSEQQVADGMGRSAVFLSLARLEAHGLTKLEAMASGCICAGYTGVYGGNDSATAMNGFWAGEEDVFGAVEQLAQAIRLVKAGGEPYRLVLEEGLLTAGKYKREDSARWLLEFWDKTARELGFSLA